MEYFVVAVVLATIVSVQGTTLCGRRSRSCAYQLWNNGSETPEACHMKYYKPNSTSCAAINFEYKTNLNNNMGDFRLIAYVNEELKQTLFNISFTKIKWQKLTMRVTKIGLENEVNMCRSFEIGENLTVPKNSALKYNCPWLEKGHGGHDFAFEYEISQPIIAYNKFIFRVPYYRNFGSLTNIKYLQIFCYLDVTDSDYLYLHIQTAAPKYNVTGYLVEVIRERSNISTKLTVQILSVKDAIKGKLIFPYPTWNEFGFFFFIVSPISESCEENACLKSSTPKIFVGRKKSSLVIGIVGASVIIFALFYAMFIWNKQKSNKDDTPPRVLLVYNASLKAHCNVVRSLARLLNDVLHVEVFLDVFDIPQTNHQNPVLWCNQAFRDATHVIYIASPEVSSTKTNPDNLYKIDNVAMKAIITKIVCSTNTKRILVITFPYSINAIPPELVNIRRFDLMKDIDSLVNSIVMLPYQSWTFLHIYRPNRFRGEPQYLELLENIQGAQKEVETLLNLTNSNQTPKITITQNSTEQDDEVKEDELLLNNDNFNHHLADLNLPRNISEECQPAVAKSAN